MSHLTFENRSNSIGNIHAHGHHLQAFKTLGDKLEETLQRNLFLQENINRLVLKVQRKEMRVKTLERENQELREANREILRRRRLSEEVSESF